MHITTVTGGDTALIPIVLNEKEVELYAAIVPAEQMPFPVILGRYIPGMQVTWNMKMVGQEGTVLQLEQTTAAPASAASCLGNEQLDQTTASPALTVGGSNKKQSRRKKFELM